MTSLLKVVHLSMAVRKSPCVAGSRWLWHKDREVLTYSYGSLDITIAIL
jgi:hypothetical protein